MNGALQRPCPNCGQEVADTEADEYGWCEECRKELRKSARRGAHLVGAAVTLPFGVWILIQGRFDVLVWYAWLLPLAVAYYLGHRIGRELIRGYRRWKRTRA